MTLKALSSRIILTILFALVGLSAAQAQYSYDALRLSTQMPAQDAHSMALGSSSVSQLQGFGSFIVNPAVAAKASSSFISVGLGIREVTQESVYPLSETSDIGQRNTFDDHQTGLLNIGFSYQVPTAVGSLVIGGGYSQTADYNSAYTINAFNEWTSRTFQFTEDYIGHRGVGYNAFALDSVNSDLWSIFEIGGFAGVDQVGDVKYRGQSGEYSLFMATEFQEDFFVGVSLGVPVSNSRFSQTFFEYAPLDFYTGNPGTGTFNIDHVMFEESIRVNAVGVNARIGLLYSGLSLIDLGASYTTRTRWNIEEKLDAFVQSTFQGNQVIQDGRVIEDGNVFSDEFRGELSYKATTPSRLHFGVSTKELPLFNFSVSAERINYTNIRLRDFDIEFREEERIENEYINQNFKNAWNFSAGATITMFDSFEPRIGWALMGNPRNYLENNERHFLSAGLGIGMSQRMSLDFAIQYSFWNSVEDLYYPPYYYSGNEFVYEPIIEEVKVDMDRFHATVGLNLRF